jgi:phage anti-repressor protein
MITKEDLAQAILDLKSELKSSQEKSDRRLDRVAKLVGNISNNQGDIAEEFFYNSMKAKPSLAGIDYDFIDKNVTRSKNNIEDEYDILLVNGKDIAIIETKYKAHTSDIEKLVTKKYENFKKLYPEYKDYNHHLGLASFYINDDVKENALENNMILLQRKGDLIETIVPSL